MSRHDWPVHALTLQLWADSDGWVVFAQFPDFWIEAGGDTAVGALWSLLLAYRHYV